jgi:hypothetical protein
MAQIPAVSLPLGESIAALEEAAQGLEQAEAAALRALNEDAPSSRR